MPLQDARQAGRPHPWRGCVVKSGATAVLIAGDIYEKQQMSQQTLARAIESMRAFKSVQWHLMPGNHDHFRENGLWDRLARLQLPSNVILHTQQGAVQIADDGGVPVFLLPAPLRFTSSVDDLSAYMDSEATPEGAIRIGMAHGSIQGFGSEGDASNYVAPGRAQEAGLSYLAMGDWHRQMRINDRCWYSGTPEPRSAQASAGRRIFAVQRWLCASCRDKRLHRAAGGLADPDQLLSVASDRKGPDRRCTS